MLLSVILDECAAHSRLLKAVIIVQDRALNNLILVGRGRTVAQLLSLGRVCLPDLLVLLELLLGAACGYGHTPGVEHAWRGAQAQAIATPFILSRVTGCRRVDLLRASQLLANLCTKDRGLMGHFLRSTSFKFHK